MVAGAAGARKAFKVDTAEDIQDSFADIYDLLTTTREEQKLLVELLTPIPSRLDAIEKRVSSMELKTDKILAAAAETQKRVDAVMERLDKPMVFEDRGGVFAATFGGRLGEEVRASIRAEVGGVAQQVYAAVDAHMKQNPVKMPTGSTLVPLAAVVAAAAATIHLYMSYQAARNYVPADVKVAVNGVAVPHRTEQTHSPSMNGRPHPMARAA